MFLLGFAILLDHGFDFGGDAAAGVAGERLLVVEAGLDAALIGGGQNAERGDQILVVDAAVGARSLGQSIGQAHKQVLFFVHEPVGEFDLQEQRGRVDIGGGARFFVLARLHEVGAVAGTVEGDLALLATALRTDATVDGGAETFFLAEITNRAAQKRAP